MKEEKEQYHHEEEAKKEHKNQFELQQVDYQHQQEVCVLLGHTQKQHEKSQAHQLAMVPSLPK